MKLLSGLTIYHRSFILAFMKILFFIVAFFVVSVCAQAADVQEPSFASQQMEEIIQKCKSSRWKLYENDPDLRNDFYLSDIVQEEISCKEEEFMQALNTIIPNLENREKVVKSFQEYKTHFLNLYGLISQKNILCDEDWLACGTRGEIANILLYDTALNNLISYALSCQDDTH